MPRVAIIQMTSGIHVAANLHQAEELCRQAALEKAQLVVLPENFALMGMTEADKLGVAEEFGHGPIQTALSHWAQTLNLWIIAGTMPIKGKNPAKVRACTLVYNNQGKQVARYDKIHLFDVTLSTSQEVYQESAAIEAGNQVVVVDTPVGRVGLSVCYDLRFAELYRLMELEGADIFVVPSAFTAITGQAHWEVLLRARAIENLCYVLAPNQTGEHENGRHTYGHSMVIDPWGKVITPYLAGKGVLITDIHLDKLRQLRAQFPTPSHHKLEFVYRGSHD